MGNMPSIAKIRAVALDLETVEGVAEVLTGADVIYCEDAKFTSSLERLLRAHHLPSISKLAAVAGRSSLSVTFKVPLYGASAAGVAPYWFKLRRICGEGQTIVTDTSVTLAPATHGVACATMKLFLDVGISLRMTGCRGTYSGSLVAGEIGYETYTITGIWDPKTDTDAVKDEAMLTGTAYPAFLPKPFVGAMVMIGSAYKARITKLNYDKGNEVKNLPDANVTAYKSVQITGRDIKGDFDPEAVTRLTEDFWSKFFNQTSFALAGYLGADESGESISIENLLVDESRDTFDVAVSDAVGTTNTVTSASAAWATSRWVGFRYQDSAGTMFYISANNGTTLTVVGTPASGAGKIMKPSSDYGTGTGSLNTLTDATKAWTADQWNNGFTLIDSANAEFAITDNAATTLTVSGTPATGAYRIVHKNHDTMTVVGTSNTATDATKSWPTNKWVGYRLKDSAGTIFEISANNGTALTVVGTPADGAGTIYLPSKNWKTSQWVGYKVRDAAGTSFAITANDGQSLTISGTPAPGPYIIYQAGKLLKITWPACQYSALSDDERDGIGAWGCQFAANLVSGDDEMSTLNV